jgi:hypothetical protein
LHLRKGFEKIAPFVMGNGGQFLWNNDLNVKEKIELMELFAYLVDDPKEINKDEERTYQVIPKIIMRFAEGARLHSGIRLLRYSDDPFDMPWIQRHLIFYFEKVHETTNK